MSFASLKSLQPKVIRILENSLENDRVAHAYLFEGAAGVGKGETATLFVKRFFCTEPQGNDPCGQCSNCKRIDSLNHPDLHFVEPDGNSIKIEQIRGLQKEFGYKSVESSRKAYIIRHAERMTTQAANGLLKFLEEPSQDVIAILLTENGRAILPTIRSRSQIISFTPLKKSILIDKVKEEVGVEKATLLANLTNDLTQAREWAADEWFNQARDIVVNMAKKILDSPDTASLDVQSTWIGHFTEKPQQQLGLEMLLLFWRDLMFLSYGNDSEIVFPESKGPTLSSSTQEGMEAILEAKQRLKSNASYALIMDTLVYQLGRRKS